MVAASAGGNACLGVIAVRLSSRRWDRLTYQRADRGNPQHTQRRKEVKVERGGKGRLVIRIHSLY